MSKLVKVEGDLAYDNGVGIVLDVYEAEFILDDENAEEAKARSIIRKTMITPYLKKKVEGFKHCRTLNIISITDTKEKPAETSEVQKLTLEAIELNCVPENLELRASDAAKEKCLKDAIRMAKIRLAKAKKKDEA